MAVCTQADFVAHKAVVRAAEQEAAVSVGSENVVRDDATVSTEAGPADPAGGRRNAKIAIAQRVGSSAVAADEIVLDGEIKNVCPVKALNGHDGVGRVGGDQIALANIRPADEGI